ncbi:MAG: hypothetical protein GX086_11980 [Alcaligenaceae bacterium]|nr:hypothetical protein [Alcaligenaceae bacterium]
MKREVPEQKALDFKIDWHDPEQTHALPAEAIGKNLWMASVTLVSDTFKIFIHLAQGQPTVLASISKFSTGEKQYA